MLTLWSPQLHKWPKSHHFLEPVNHEHYVAWLYLIIWLPLVPYLFASFPGCEQVAWTVRISSAFQVRDGLELHGVFITCEACRGRRQGQWHMGCPSSLAELVRRKVRHCWFWPTRVQEYPKGRGWWAHADLPDDAKHVSIYCPHPYLTCFLCAWESKEEKLRY